MTWKFKVGLDRREYEGTDWYRVSRGQTGLLGQFIPTKKIVKKERKSIKDLVWLACDYASLLWHNIKSNNHFFKWNE